MALPCVLRLGALVAALGGRGSGRIGTVCDGGGSGVGGGICDRILTAAQAVGHWCVLTYVPLPPQRLVR